MVKAEMMVMIDGDCDDANDSDDYGDDADGDNNSDDNDW